MTMSNHQDGHMGHSDHQGGHMNDTEHMEIFAMMTPEMASHKAVME